MTPVVIDASAGVELLAGSDRGRLIRRLLPRDVVPWVPELFYVECGAVLRRLDRKRVLSADEAAAVVEQLTAWPLNIAQVRPLISGAWRLRDNLTFSDALYVVLAEQLGAALLTDDHRLANAPGLPVPTIRLPSSR